MEVSSVRKRNLRQLTSVYPRWVWNPYHLFITKSDPKGNLDRVEDRKFLINVSRVVTVRTITRTEGFVCTKLWISLWRPLIILFYGFHLPLSTPFQVVFRLYTLIWNFWNGDGSNIWKWRHGGSLPLTQSNIVSTETFPSCVGVGTSGVYVDCYGSRDDIPIREQWFRDFDNGTVPDLDKPSLSHFHPLLIKRLNLYWRRQVYWVSKSLWVL